MLDIPSQLLRRYLNDATLLIRPKKHRSSATGIDGESRLDDHREAVPRGHSDFAAYFRLLHLARPHAACAIRCRCTSTRGSPSSRSGNLCIGGSASFARPTREPPADCRTRATPGSRQCRNAMSKAPCGPCCGRCSVGESRCSWTPWPGTSTDRRARCACNWRDHLGRFATCAMRRGGIGT